jgi:hypothetical protein
MIALESAVILLVEDLDDDILLVAKRSIKLGSPAPFTLLEMARRPLPIWRGMAVTPIGRTIRCRPLSSWTLKCRISTVSKF